MHILSTGKKTVLSDFAHLETRSEYIHAQVGDTDFQFFEQHRVFVEVNKEKFGVEIMRIKQNGTQLDIQRVLKVNKENVCFVGCRKKSMEEIALGHSNGQVLLYNYKKSENVYRFTGETKSSVIFLDYNASDEYIAAVHENGLINVYGMMTKTKTDKINIDDSSYLARFHPTKRLHLAIASQRGSVTVIDIQSKKHIFQNENAHLTPCRDLCMAANTPHMLLTAGFDCVVNIFDIRYRKTPHKISLSYPLSTVATTECGTYFCVGNLKGELITFDRRNMSNCLTTKQVHEGQVNRVAFVPANSDTGCSFFSTADQSNVTSSNVSAIQPSIETDKYVDSFYLPAADPAVRNRESVDWAVALRASPITGDSSGLLSARFSGVDFRTLPANTSNVNTRTRGHSGVLQERNRLSGLRFSRDFGQLKDSKMDRISCESSDKENPINEFEMNHGLRQLQDEGKSSTPHREQNPPDDDGNATVANEIAALREHMDERLHLLESNILFNADGNKWNIFSQSFNLWRQQYQLSEEIHQAVGMLMQADPFVNEFRRLQQENELLKRRLSGSAGDRKE